MKIFEIGTGYTSIPAQMGAATEIVVEELTRAMLWLGVDVTILDIKDKNRQSSDLPIEEIYMPQMFSTGSVVKLGIVHKIKRVLYSIMLTQKLKRTIKHSEEQIYLHFHNQYNLYFFLKLTSKEIRKRVTIGYTVHSHVWFGEWESIKDIIRRRYFQEVYCCQSADKIFVLNDIVAKMLAEHYGVDASRIVKVVNGVNTDVYNEQVADKDTVNEIRQEYGLDGKKIIFQVGSVCDRKNQLGSLKLLMPLMLKDERLVFAYAGGIIDDNYAQAIVEKAKEAGVENRVIYFGEVSPGKILNQLYTLADVCIMNSKSEAFALVIAEALSVPRPIFINESIMASLPFLGKNLGNGILQIDKDFEKKFLRIIDDEKYAEDLKNKGRRFIKDEYSWLAAAKQYLDSLGH